MMEISNLNKTLSDIFKAKYIIPLYQRNFAWSDEEISQLLQDMYESYRKDKNGNYFIGSLVVLRRRNGDFEVIDGQQRLTVITLIAKVLNVDFLTEPKLFYDSRPEVESFLTSFYHTGKTNDVTFDYKVSHLVRAVDVIIDSIINPDEKEQKTVLKIDDLNDFKRFFSKNIILVKVEIPGDTDVANYFEIMNNRGEQLQKHEILKAKLMDSIKKEDGLHDIETQKVFSKIWDACSQMDIPVQKLFSKEDREIIFGENYDNFSVNGFSGLLDSLTKDKKTETEFFTIDDILLNPVNELNNNPSIDDIDDESDDKSIIDFPNFLMHILKIKYNDNYKGKIGSDNSENDIPLNEKELLSVFKTISEDIEPVDFIESLLYYRTVFDRYIIKASTDEKSEDNYKWSLEKPYKYLYEKRNSTSLKYKTTFDHQERILKSLSLLQVTFRNRKYKNWLFEILNFFSDRNNLLIEKNVYQKFIDEWLIQYYNNIFEDITEVLPYIEGTRTPHFLLNFIDYLYWVDSINNPEKNKFEFEFKYRNSVEHHLPQSFRNETNRIWIDNLGNLCLISKSSNSKMNNEDPVGKANISGKYYKTTLPPKQKIMYDLTNQKRNWGIEEIKMQYKEVVILLNKAGEILSIN